MFKVSHRSPDGSQARVRMDDDVRAGRRNRRGTKSRKPLIPKMKIQEGWFNIRTMCLLWMLLLWRPLTCKRWRWSSVSESCSISHRFLSSSVISSSSSAMSRSALCSAAACFLWIISTNSVSIFSMERIRAAKTSRLSIVSLLEFSYRSHVKFASIWSNVLVDVLCL